MSDNNEFNVQSAREIATVIQAHFAWRTRIQSTIDGTNTENFSVNTASDCTKCTLGEWINSDGAKKLSNNPIFQTLDEEHTLFHQHAGKALHLAQEGKKDEAQQSISTGDLAQASNKVLSALTQLHQEVKKL
ncbi:MAG: hypothetical protein GX087_11005 [Desulfobulbaceae bacterium]|nr:hypothetical protein [Desulfobulbaceae bacterium]